jgi:hypothetical protein
MNTDYNMQWIQSAVGNPKVSGKNREEIYYPYRTGTDLVGLNGYAMHLIRELPNVEQPHRIGTIEDWGTYPNYEILIRDNSNHIGEIESTLELREALKHGSKLIEYARLLRLSNGNFLASEPNCDIDLRIRFDGELHETLGDGTYIHLGRLLSAITFGAKDHRRTWQLHTSVAGGRYPNVLQLSSHNLTAVLVTSRRPSHDN